MRQSQNRGALMLGIFFLPNTSYQWCNPLVARYSHEYWTLSVFSRCEKSKRPSNTTNEEQPSKGISSNPKLTKLGACKQSSKGDYLQTTLYHWWKVSSLVLTRVKTRLPRSILGLPMITPISASTQARKIIDAGPHL